jgi:hypothetical protein
VLIGEVDLRLEVIEPGARAGFVGSVGIDVRSGQPVVPTLSGGLLFRSKRSAARARVDAPAADPPP